MLSSSLSLHSVICPICGAGLCASGPLYAVDELFEMWKPIKFSAETIEEHMRQSAHTQMYFCERCCLDIFLPQIIGTPSFYEEAYSLYSSTSGPDVFTYSQDKWDFHAALKDLAGSRSVLEVGCGAGDFLAMVGRLIPEVRGIEYNEAALKLAQNRGLRVLRFLDDLDFGKEHFDVAFSFHVLEHVSDPISFMKELSAWVKPGGRIGVSVPNQDGPIKYISPCIMNMPPHHSTRWRLRTLKVMAERVGLIVTHVAYEPLLLQNHSYYSFHWLNHRFKGGGIAPKLARRILSRGMNTLFGALIKINRKDFRFLRGQSIYVSLLKSC